MPSLPGLSYLGVFDDGTVNSSIIGMTEASSTEHWTRRLPQMDIVLPRSPAVRAIKWVHFNSLYFAVTVSICSRVHIFMLRATYIITLQHTSVFYFANPSFYFDHIIFPNYNY